jgi:hypothetical protein
MKNIMGVLVLGLIIGFLLGLLGYFILGLGPYSNRVSRSSFNNSDTIETIKDRGNIGFGIGFSIGFVVVLGIWVKNKK